MRFQSIAASLLALVTLSGTSLCSASAPQDNSAPYEKPLRSSYVVSVTPDSPCALQCATGSITINSTSSSTTFTVRQLLPHARYKDHEPRWFVLSPSDDSQLATWSGAYKLIDSLDKTAEGAVYAEPNNLLLPLQGTAERGHHEASWFNRKDLEHDSDGYLKAWARPPEDDPTWYRGKRYSQLEDAWMRVRTELFPANTQPARRVRIAHVDRGYCGSCVQDRPKRRDEDPQPDAAEPFGHLIPCLDIDPENIANGRTAQDSCRQSKVLGQATGPMGHGTGTLSILASPRFGGAPFADIYEMKIVDSVMMQYNTPFVDAIDQAIANDCDVMSISLGGVPSRLWAVAIDKAYDSGLTICAAASDSGYIIGRNPDMVWPARFKKTIAATGCTYDRRPYYKSTSFYDVQGSYGPQTAMYHAITAYTPNVSWAFCPDCNGTAGHADGIDRDGGGTSSATPQVASAAALWLQYHVYNPNSLEYKQRLGQDPDTKWQKVEAVKLALAQSASRSALHDIDDAVNTKSCELPAGVPAPLERPFDYFGPGLLKANRALDVSVDASTLRRDRSPSGIYGDEKAWYLSRLIDPDLPRSSMLQQELLTLTAQTITDLDQAIDNTQDWLPTSSERLRGLISKLVDMPNLSSELRQALAKATECPSLSSSDMELKRLAVGESARFKVCARQTSNTAAMLLSDGDRIVPGISVQNGDVYSIQPDPNDRWIDLIIPSDAAGYPELLAQRWSRDLFHSRLRIDKKNYMALVCQILNGKKATTALVYDGNTNELTAPCDGELTLFANDQCGAYYNNFGYINVVVKRTH